MQNILSLSDYLFANWQHYRRWRKGIWVLFRMNLTFDRATFWVRYSTVDEYYLHTDGGDSTAIKVEDWNS